MYACSVSLDLDQSHMKDVWASSVSGSHCPSPRDGASVDLQPWCSSYDSMAGALPTSARRDQPCNCVCLKRRCLHDTVDYLDTKLVKFKGCFPRETAKSGDLIEGSTRAKPGAAGPERCAVGNHSCPDIASLCSMHAQSSQTHACKLYSQIRSTVVVVYSATVE